MATSDNTPAKPAAKTAAPRSATRRTVTVKAAKVAPVVEESAVPVANEPVAPVAAIVAEPVEVVVAVSEIVVPEAPVAEVAAEPAPAAEAPVPVPEAIPVVAESVSKPVVEAPASVSPPAPTASTRPQPAQTLVKFMTTTATFKPFDFKGFDFKGFDGFSTFGKANLDALVEANTVFAKGIEELSKEVISLTQASLESNAAAAKAIFSAKTLKDAVELNADYSKQNFDKLVANSTKLGELSIKLATDTFAPITAAITSAVEKSAKPSA